MAPRLFVCFGRARGGGGRKVSSAASTASDANSTADLTVEEQRQTGPVLVELFSSQGCGSSPEAEVVASRLGQGNLELEGEGEVPPAVVLAFHVEYWDYRGWKDPFGSSTWTVRQKAYVDALRLDTLYTPQLVVNGCSQCVGNDLDAVSAAVRSAPRFPSPAMQATFEVPSPDTLEVLFTGSLRTKIDGSGADVSVALYESGLVTNCENGENKGRVLANDYVVRRLEKLLSVKDVSANKSLSGTVIFDIWEGFNASKSGLVLFIQNASMQIFGVQRFQIPDTIN